MTDPEMWDGAPPSLRVTSFEHYPGMVVNNLVVAAPAPTIPEDREVWAPIPGSNCLASNQGRIRNNRTKRIIKPVPRNKGKIRNYFSLYVREQNRNLLKQTAVSRAVLCAFTFKPLSYPLLCRHLNDDAVDDRLVNLAWGTAQDNGADMKRNRTLRSESW